MTPENVKAQLSAVAPTAMHAFRTEHDLPYIIFYFEDCGVEKSDDGSVEISSKELTIELYTDKKSRLLEEKTEAGILKELDYQKSESWLDDERILVTTYTAILTQKGR